MNIIGLLIALLVCCVIFWAASTLMAVFDVPAQIRTVVLVLFVLLMVLWLVQSIGYLPGPALRLH